MATLAEPLLAAPDRSGWWRIDHQEVTGWRNNQAASWAPATLEVEVYPLEPVGDTLCVWGEDIGGGFDGPSEIWDTDEWLGHIPVRCLAGQFLSPRFTYLRPLD